MPITIPKLSERVIAIDDATFTVGPECYDDFSASLEFIRRNGLQGSVAGYQGAGYLVARRIKSWTGIVLQDDVLEDGSPAPAPCTERNKLTLFGSDPQLLDRIVQELARQEDADRKNLSPTQSS